MTIQISPLARVEADDIEKKRDWVKAHLPADRIDKAYATVEGKLSLIDTIIVNKWVGPQDILHLQCLGVSLGDAIAQQLGMRWVLADDGQERMPALNLPGHDVLAYPIGLIADKMQSGIEPNVYDLFHAAWKQIYDASLDKPDQLALN